MSLGHDSEATILSAVPGVSSRTGQWARPTTPFTPVSPTHHNTGTAVLTVSRRAGSMAGDHCICCSGKSLLHGLTEEYAAPREAGC